MRVVTFVNNRFRPAHPGCPEVEIGTALYAVQDDGNSRLYFIWCYLDESFAKHMAEKVSIDSDRDRALNWRPSTDDLVASHRKTREDS